MNYARLAELKIEIIRDYDDLLHTEREKAIARSVLERYHRSIVDEMSDTQTVFYQP